jgi:hypothetical protein
MQGVGERGRKVARGTGLHRNCSHPRNTTGKELPTQLLHTACCSFNRPSVRAMATAAARGPSGFAAGAAAAEVPRLLLKAPGAGESAAAAKVPPP